MTTIVIAWKSTRLNGLAGATTPHKCAVVWLNNGTAHDVASAAKFARLEDSKNDGSSGRTVFVFDDEPHPLERAREALV